MRQSPARRSSSRGMTRSRYRSADSFFPARSPSSGWRTVWVQTVVPRYDQVMQLLEREGDLGLLDRALANAGQGSGSVVLVGGEAGLGKTRLVQAFASRNEDAARILWGACDDLSTPRTLGPFHDIALQVGGALREAVAEGSRGEVFDAALELIGDGSEPTALIVEDVHWADGATLDVLKFLGRRVGRANTTLILTFRSEEVGSDHPLMLVIGDLSADVLVRTELAPLSEAAVAHLATGYPGSTADLFASTQGNPFLVTEALLAGAGSVPANVRDAVRSRVARLSGPGRALAEFASVVPSQTERWLLEALPEYSPAALAECRDRGLLEYDSRAAWYRHELVRGAVERSLAPDRRRAWNGLAFEALAERNADDARIVHHARGASNADGIARYAPPAALRASAAAAHKEALAHLRAAVHEGSRPADDDWAQLLTDYAIECYLTNEAMEGLGAAEEALAIWRMLDNGLREGDTLRWLSRLHWWQGHGDDAIQTGRAAVDILSALPASPELAMAYSNLAQVFMLAQRADEAESWATKAISVARTVDDKSTLAHALNNLGSTRLRSGDQDGWPLLEESLAIAVADGFDDHAGRAYANIIWTALDYRDYDVAAKYLAEGLEYAWLHELAGSLYYMTAERARMHLERGDWDDAETDAQWVMARPEEPGITNMPALATMARLRVRRGDPEARGSLDAAWSLAEPTGELQRIAPVAAARAEFAWLRGDSDGILEAVADAHALAVSVRQPWIVDELAFWMWRGGEKVKSPEDSTTPYAMHIGGAAHEASELWAQLGCPYEQALALADCDDVSAIRKALVILDDLGAVPAAAKVRGQLRKLGAQHVPRGPRSTTRANPAGLTTRQVEVLVLLADGLTNREISSRLFVSVKTVDHHVSAILLKLEASTRHEAVKVAREQGLV